VKVPKTMGEQREGAKNDGGTTCEAQRERHKDKGGAK